MWPDDETPEPAAWINFNASTVENNELGTSVTFTDEKLATSPARGPKPPTATGGET